MRLFIPTDLSERSVVVVSQWLKAFDRSGTSITLVHIIEPVGGSGAIMIDISQVLRKEAVKQMDEIIAKANLKSAKLDYRVEDGYYADKLSELVNVFNPNFVLMPSKAKKGIDRFFTGQKAKKFIGKLNVPVLIVPDNMEEISFRRIGLAVDFQDAPTTKTESVLEEFEAYFDARVFSFHIDTDKEEDESFYNELKASGIYSQFEMHKAVTVQAGIKEYIAKEDIDLLVLLTHKKGFFERLTDDNVSKYFVSDNNQPVLIINQK